MKRALVYLTGAALCTPTLFGAPGNGLTILGLALIGTVVAATFIIENERTKQP